MAEVAATRVTDIVSVTYGGNTYKCAKEGSLEVSDPVIVPARDGGNAYPDSMDRTYTEDFPVKFNFTLEDVNQLPTLLSATAGDFVVECKVFGSTTNKLVTLPDALVRQARAQVSATGNRMGTTSMQAVAVSSDGSTLPLAITDAS